MAGCDRYNNIRVLLVITAELMALMLVSADVTQHFLHECYFNTHIPISISCDPEHVILIHNVLVGTSDVWASGTANCPNDNQRCMGTTHEPFDECDMKSNCTIDKTVIAKDLHGGCPLTNFISITYMCVPESLVNGRSSINMCEENEHVGFSGMIAYNFVRLHQEDQLECSCNIRNVDSNVPKVNVTALLVGVHGPPNNCKSKSSLTLNSHESCPAEVYHQSREGLLSLYNTTLATNIGVSRNRYTIGINIDKNSGFPPSRLLLDIKATQNVSIRCCPGNSCGFTPTTRGTSTSGVTPTSTTTISTLPGTQPTGVYTTQSTEHDNTDTTKEMITGADFPVVPVAVTLAVVFVVIIIVVTVVVIVVRKRKVKKESEGTENLASSSGNDVIDEHKAEPKADDVIKVDISDIGDTEIVDNTNYSSFETDENVPLPPSIIKSGVKRDPMPSLDGAGFDNPDYFLETIYGKKLSKTYSNGQVKYEEIPCDQPNNRISNRDPDDIYFEIDENNGIVNKPIGVAMDRDSGVPCEVPRLYEDIPAVAPENPGSELGDESDDQDIHSPTIPAKRLALPALPDEGQVAGSKTDYSEIWVDDKKQVSKHGYEDVDLEAMGVNDTSTSVHEQGQDISQ